MSEIDRTTAPSRNSARRPTALDHRIGQAIRERRQALNLRLEDLARALNIAPHQLQKYETGGNRIPASRLVECAHALEVPVAWFYRTAGAQKAPPTSGLSSDETLLLETFRSLDTEARDHLLGLLRLLTRK